MKRPWYGALALVMAIAGAALADGVFVPEDIFNTRYATSARISPDGKWIAYTVSVPPDVDNQSVGRYAHLYVVSTSTGESRAFVTGKINTGTIRWSPRGTHIAFRMKRGKDAKSQVWTIPIDGGEATPATQSKTSVSTYEWHPSGDRIAYVAAAAKGKREKALDKKGFGFKYVEEDLKNRNLYVADFDPLEPSTGEVLVEDVSVWSMRFSPDGELLAFSASPRNLIDERYAFRRLYLLDMASKAVQPLSDNPRKLGGFVFSPKGDKIAFTAARDQSDHNVSQLFVRAVAGGDAANLTVPEFKGHVEGCAWKDNNTVVYTSSEGMWRTLSTVKATGGERKVILHGEREKLGFTGPDVTTDFKHFAFLGSTNDHPNEVYYWNGKGRLKRLTKLNPWLEERKLGRVEVVTHEARDGWPVEGLLYYPVDYREGERYPLIVAVHGGPEAHHSYSWRTSYSRPVQVLAGRGYAVWLPNYRSSTGYGLAHVEKHRGDPAGTEFDDVADGIDYLVEIGVADRERVGLGGGSYGGYAAAWFATYYTDYVKAAFMFVGISDLISKRGTTDIPYEELYVHSGKTLEEMWELSLERSPIYHAHKSKTATLIAGGTNDTRVHPAQSLELFRRMKMNDHPAVRLVQYPGERHGNRKMPARRDVLFRLLDWYDWYVKDLNPLSGDMPPLDISEKYGLDLPEEQDDAADSQP